MSANQGNPCKYTDGEWVRLLKHEADAKSKEEKTAVQEAVECLWRELFTFCLHKCRYYSLDEQIATDAATDSYFRIRHAVDSDQYKFGCPFLNYCYIIAANRIRSLLRKELNRSKREVDFPTEYDQE
jgi:DNA-directed RNA polymerase specialized sigma24 family protein